MKKLILTILISSCFTQTIKSNDQKYITKKDLFKKYVANTLPGYLFLGPYSFMYGVNLGGNSIKDGNSPQKANTLWLATPLMAGFLVNQITKDILKTILDRPIQDDKSSTFYYNIFYIGPDISTIKDIQFQGIDSNWEAQIDEVPSGYDYPPLGFRTGFVTDRYGMDYEMSLIAHHTIEKNIIYEYNSPETGIVPLPQNIPSHFYMLHSMFMGLNAYYVLPDFILTPYVGFGGGLLLNSVQSEYAGPADLAREGGSLALDEMDWNYGVHSFLGFRYMSDNSFYYLELRPSVNRFKLESGSSPNKSKDSFNLESFQFQLGIGRNIF